MNVLKLIVIRHAEIPENLEKLKAHPEEGDLTEKGIDQARKLGERLKDEKFDVIICSTAERACETAKEIIKNHPGVDVVYSKGIIEQSPGEHVGITDSELRDHRQKSGYSKETYRPKGGESFQDLIIRATNFYEHLLDKYKGKTVLVMTHGRFMKALMIVMFNIPIQFHSAMWFGNTAVNIVEVNDDGKLVHLVNCFDHL